MRINTLELTNVRGFTHAIFEFQPGFNLIVGINGVGKTTVLESLRIVLSHIVPDATISKSKKDYFDEYDIQINKEGLQLDSKFLIEKNTHSFVLSQQKDSTKVVETENIREQTYEVKDFTDFKPNISKEHKSNKNQPLGIYFSSHRSLMNDEKPSKSQTVGGQAVAFVDALHTKREFSIRLFADWFLAQEALGTENPKLLQKLKNIKEAIYTFLPGFSNLNVIKDLRGDKNTFSIDKDDKTFSFQQLSDGERSVITLVLDIARRLTIANTDLRNPMDGEAIILIDELDLHLHPKWQRSVVSDLVRTFPNCQFIATTHSPQIIGEVHPKSITIIDRNKDTEVYKPNVAFGLDAQRVLEELLDAPIRNIKIQEGIDKVNSAVDEEKYEDAKVKISELKETLGENDPELIRLNSMIQFLEEDFGDEENN